MLMLLFMNFEMLGVFLSGWLLCKNLFMYEEYNSYYKMSVLNFWMVFLILLLYLMMLSTKFFYSMSMNLLLVVLLLLMMSSNFIVFFLFYEMVFVLIMFVILLLGYSYERLIAAYLMMFYSFLFSSPALMVMLVFDYTFLMKNWLDYAFIFNYFLMGSFMVKFPIFGFHYWLPVAHVEASTLGSMLLAGVLLKLGSVGLYYLIFYLKFMVKFHWLVLGVLLVMMFILFLSDMKMMIAYSSIAHMTMVFYVMMLGSLVGEKGAIMMMFYHGFLSPLMFWTVGLLAWWKTRSLFVVKFLSFSFYFIGLVFIMSIMNMGFPPFLGFLSEILMLKSFLNLSFILYIMVFSVLFSCYYNIYLFWVFNNGRIFPFKVSIYGLDVYMFMLWVIMLNI